MCPPPLVCPLCASAGGFTSPGALWLGLIGVANRLLSCPVCHELLLGLDKLTIHLVSHVTDLNLLASSIGNHRNFNQKDNNESITTESCGVNDQGPSFTNIDVTSGRKKQVPIRISSKVNESNHVDHGCQNNCFSAATRSNDKYSTNFEAVNFFNQKLVLTRPHFNHTCDVMGNGGISPTMLSNKCSIENDITLATSKDNEAVERVNFESAPEGSPNKMPVDMSSVQFSRSSDNYSVKPSTANPSQSLPVKKDKHNTVLKSDSHSLNNVLPLSSKEKMSTIEPFHGQPASIDDTILYHDKSNGWVHYDNKYLEIRGNTKVPDTILHSEKQNITRCGLCSMIFDDPNCLKLHYVIVHPSEDLRNSPLDQTTSQIVNNFPCRLCNRKLVSNSDLLVHMRFAHSVIPGNSSDGDLEKKLFAAESKEKIKKLVAFTNFDIQNQKKITEKLQMESIKTSKSYEISTPDEFVEKSPICKNIQKDSMVNVDERQYNSNDSLKTTDNENSQDTNKEEYSNGSPQQYTVDEEVKHSCKVCDAQFGSITELIAHRPAHIEENGCICVVCGKTFKKEQHLQQHLRTHEGKQWECDVCCKFFTTKYFLKKHKRLHTGEMPYCCETCGKTFTFQQSYHKHLLYHSDEKPHACSECGKRFKELSTLHNHERIHTGEKPFTCESCGKAFRQRVSYLVHRRIHTGVMPYKCTACEKSFRYKVSQRTHKCSSQQTGTVVRQSSDLVERLLSHQKDKLLTMEGLNKTSEMTFSDGSTECSLNRCQKEDEKLHSLTKFSSTIESRNDVNSNSLNLDSNSIHSNPETIILNDSQNANSSFIDQNSGSLTTELNSHGKNMSHFEFPVPHEGGGMQSGAYDLRQALPTAGREEKSSEPHQSESEKKAVNTAGCAMIRSHSKDSTTSNFMFTCDSASKLQHHQVLNSKCIEIKVPITRGNDNRVGEIFDPLIFPSEPHIIPPSETDFFSLVMPPADPALEKLGKLSISSLPSPEKPNSGLHFQNDQYIEVNAEKMDSNVKAPDVSPNNIQKNFDNLNTHTKHSFIDIDNSESSRDQDSTANAADLSSFLQSCLEQWHPSNFISSEKEKDNLATQDSLEATTSKPRPCPTEAEDNRLHTINEESLRKLLYGDNAL